MSFCGRTASNTGEWSRRAYTRPACAYEVAWSNECGYPADFREGLVYFNMRWVSEGLQMPYNIAVTVDLR